MYLFAVFIKGAYVFNRLRVPPSVCMGIQNITEGDCEWINVFWNNMRAY